MKSQERMKHYADKGRSDGEFIVGDLVYLKLQPADFSGQQKAPQTKSKVLWSFRNHRKDWHFGL